jgi:hypothetical protein
MEDQDAGAGDIFSVSTIYKTAQVTRQTVPRPAVQKDNFLIHPCFPKDTLYLAPTIVEN